MTRVPLSIPRNSVVRIRRERWRVVAESSFENISLLDVDGCDAANAGIRARFILPFEHVDRVAAPSPAPRFVTPVRWRRFACTALATAVPRWGSLRAAAHANLAVLPFQLEPALAVASGTACRILIADEVGLGKTIQAGLIVAESIVRIVDARILIVSPAGLREQWRDELRSRFQLHAEILDAEGVARIAATVAPDVNPWSLPPIAITSMDYVKRAEVMRALEPLMWDVVIFDEAHGLAGRSDRAAAAATLAQRARTVVLLTATPHSGDDDAFVRLASLGDADEQFPLVTFRRSRSQVGLPQGRRLVSMRVRPGMAEQAMHRTLDRYVRRLMNDAVDAAGAGLLASVLARRACSSAFSLARSIERRMSLLAGAPRAEPPQPTLPFTDPEGDEEPASELGMPGLRNESEEHVWLRDVAAAARAAASQESKIGALKRLLRRIREPVLVFTEYRDTLEHLADALAQFQPLMLHGGLGARERGAALRAFSSGNARLLLATDAASEGLNLHHRCRVVVNLELPWTPSRLEQRIGRVDRLGQDRRVHAVQFVAEGTREQALELRLNERAERIQAAIQPQPEAALQEMACDEATRLVAAKTLAATVPNPAGSIRPVVTAIAGAQHRSAIWTFQLACLDSAGQSLFEAVAALRDERGPCELDEAVWRTIARHHAEVLAATSAEINRWAKLAIDREEALLRTLDATQGRLSAALVQPGLFDRRAERAAAAQATRIEEAAARSRTRLAAIARWRDLHAGECTLLFGISFRE
jgi:superfamily II DNA or RNA helicase